MLPLAYGQDAWELDTDLEALFTVSLVIPQFTLEASAVGMQDPSYGSSYTKKTLGACLCMMSVTIYLPLDHPGRCPANLGQVPSVRCKPYL